LDPFNFVNEKQIRHFYHICINCLFAFIASALLKLAQSFMAHKAPLRVGVVFCSESREESNSLDEELPTNQADVIRRIMNHALAEGKIRNSFTSLVDVSRKFCSLPFFTPSIL